jgi:hypothetical protein
MSKKRFAIYACIGVAAALAAAVGVNVACSTPEECTLANPTTCGSDTCVDLFTDPTHCGSCTFSCGGGECTAGVCRCGGSVCHLGEICCGNDCADLDINPDHCGLCEIACSPGQACTGGVCGGEACPGGCGTGLTCCGLGCVDTDTSNDNCGACGTVCPTGQACEGGSCVMSACTPACTAPERCCGAACVNITEDMLNCGYCGNRCGEEDPPLSNDCLELSGTAQCACNGARECMPGQACCTEGCRNLSVDNRNCGACGNICADGMRCVGGACSCGDTGGPCPDGQTCCSAACVDTTNDFANCGGCGVACNATRSDVCDEGTCRCGTNDQCSAGAIFMCPAAEPANYPERCCDGGCVQIADTDCTACGTACPDGQVCLTTLTPMLAPCNFTCQVDPSGGDAGTWDAGEDTGPGETGVDSGTVDAGTTDTGVDAG